MFADLCASINNETTPNLRNCGCDEIVCYKALRVPAKDRTSLMFWKENAHQSVPSLVRNCQMCFCVSAVSLQPECDFSSVGHTITDAHSRLNPSTVKALEVVRWGYRSAAVDSCYRSLPDNYTYI